MVPADDGRLAQQVMAEIGLEVRRRREAGDLPAGLERELEAAFERFAPATHPDRARVEAVKQAAAIDVDVPVAAGRRPEVLARRLVRRAMGWYLNYLAQQIRAYASAAVGALDLLDGRIAALEERARWVVPDDPGPGPEVADLSGWHELVATRLGPGDGPPGRVLHAECGDGSLLRALVEAGADAYGADPRPEAAEQAVAAGLDAWPDHAIGHLETVAEGGLAGVVLSGCVDRLGVAGQRRLVELASGRLAPGAAVVVLSTSPRTWARRTPSVEADLAGGRPLHAETWRRLLSEAGMTGVEVHPGRPEPGLAPWPASPGAGGALREGGREGGGEALREGGGPGGGGALREGGREGGGEALQEGPIQAALAKLDRDLFGPASYAVVATRPT